MENEWPNCGVDIHDDLAGKEDDDDDVVSFCW